jgi:hypothetical protein
MSSSATTISDAKATGKRSLSSATLNMRFMQRKTMRESAASSGHERGIEHDSPSNHSSTEPLSRSLSTQTNIPGEGMNKIDNTLHPTVILASSSDMYGEVPVGRRSFNMFNKAVEETYKKALDTRRRQQ